MNDTEPIKGDGRKEVSIQQVIVTTNNRRGVGTADEPFRRVLQVWTIDGELMAEKDPVPTYSLPRPAPAKEPELVLDLAGRLAMANARISKLREVLLEIRDHSSIVPHGMMETVKSVLADSIGVPADDYRAPDYTER